ncbi:hypothetical protein E1297_31805 [Roseibium sp. RKSG952]|nr:hypothetical protein [Roseibium sp. RKSG952]
MIPLEMFEGILVKLTRESERKNVTAQLVLKHRDDTLSILLSKSERPEELAHIWSAWARALELPMLVCTDGSRIKPIDAFSAKASGAPAPRRKLRLITGRRPRFLVARRTGHLSSRPGSHCGGREIIARS